MAKETPPPEQPHAEAQQPEQATPSPFTLKKILMIGAPLLLVQLVVAYFLVGKIVAPTTVDAGTTHEPAEQDSIAEHTSEVFVVKDLLVNPAGTNGTRYLLTTVGLEVSTPESLVELEKKEVQVRDLLITILATKTLSELTDLERREAIREEISVKAKSLIKSHQLKSVYFSKFIIQ
jgi:flagellar protein FliL